MTVSRLALAAALLTTACWPLDDPPSDEPVGPSELDERHLQALPPEAIRDLSSIDERIEAIEVELAAAGQNAENAREQLAQTKEELRAVKERKAETVDDQAEAASEGQAEVATTARRAARELEDQLEAVQDRYAKAEDEAVKAERLVARVRADLELAKARRALRQARGAREGGAQVDVAAFEAAAREAAAELEAAEQAYEEVLDPGEEPPVVIEQNP